LIEIQYPRVQVAYKDQLFMHQLTEGDIDVLIEMKFKYWMQFLIDNHFRGELNMQGQRLAPVNFDSA